MVRVLGLLFVLGAVSAPAAGASGWSLQSTPNPTGAADLKLAGVSCTSGSACIAVGHYSNGGLLAERWNGTEWSIQRTPNPGGASYSELNGVSCTSMSACIAVGDYTIGATEVTLAERWNGTGWSIETTPNPAGATNSQFNGVSCTAASACTAVGSSDYGKPLAERWNGTEWSMQPTPAPAGGTLNGVSCTSTTACSAVGSYWKGSDTVVTLAERWNGTTWSMQMTPNRAGSVSELKGVACISASACTAVGDFDIGSGQLLTLAEHWNGSKWSLQGTPNPGDYADGALDSVSCTSTSACTAVGNALPYERNVAERWNGSKWSLLTTPRPAGTAVIVLDAVSCISASACTGVGSYYDGTAEVTLAERWNGNKWSIQPTPSPIGAGAIELDGVSCNSRGACTAVGSSVYNYGRTLAERWNGVNWSIQRSPSPRLATELALYDVSCPSTRACTAVGHWDNYNENGVDSGTLAERWNGATWSIQRTPPTAGTLNGVSCTSPGACTAVGSYYDGTAEVTLGERWNGAKWSIQRTPNPAGATQVTLSGVSCASKSACTAVGHYDIGTTEVTLAERWNGRTWSIQETPNPSGATDIALNGVSCASKRACTAVGHYDIGATEMPLAERWNGSRWSIQKTDSPNGATLDGVSCPSKRACTAVGHYLNGGSSRTLAQRWSG